MTSPCIQSTDPLLELKPTVRGGKDVWLVSVQGDFTTPAALARLIWPSRQKEPPGVSITVVGPHKPSAPDQRTDFEVGGIAPWTLRTMDVSFAARFGELGLAPDSSELVKARVTFRKEHDDLGYWALYNIDAALRRITMGNPGLLVAYYDFYADWKLTADIDADSNNAGKTDRTIRRGGFTDLNAGVLHLRELPQLATDDTLTLLGETLMHEFTHTAHASDYLPGPGEGKAYGVEAFFAERFSDKKRDEAATDLGSRKGDSDAFNTAYFVLKGLYGVIDTHRSKVASLQGITPERAQELATEFISKNKLDFSAQLKEIVIEVWGQKGYNSLPSQE